MLERQSIQSETIAALKGTKKAWPGTHQAKLVSKAELSCGDSGRTDLGASHGRSHRQP